jgi:hypothetical protein
MLPVAMLALAAHVLPIAGAPVNPAAPAEARIPTAPGEALIVNSGSTNTAGYQLRVYADGTTALLQDGTTQRTRAPRALVDRFFADLHMAGPLDALPRTFCMKSASFGTATTIAYRGKISPDISCPARSAAGSALAADARALAGAVGVSSLRRALAP